MTRKDYTMLAEIVGHTLGAICDECGENARTVCYDALYRPLVSALQRENEHFDNLKFAAAVGSAEAEYGNTARVMRNA